MEELDAPRFQRYTFSEFASAGDYQGSTEPIGGAGLRKRGGYGQEGTGLMVYEFWRNPEQRKWQFIEKPKSDAERQALIDEFTQGMDRAIKEILEGESNE